MKTNSMISIYWTTIGRKLFMGLTGLLLVGFITVHLLGNLTLFMGNYNLINLYAHKLESLGVALYVAELFLVAFFVVHITIGITLQIKNWIARPQGYSIKRDAAGPSRKTWSSRTMIYTGSLILIFLVFHIVTLKFGPGFRGEEAYRVSVDGENMRNLHKLIVEYFQNIWVVVFYVVIMLLLGMHLRHGFWSAFQSIGATKPSTTNWIYALGLILAIIFALGFVAMPIYIHVALDPASINY